MTVLNARYAAAGSGAARGLVVSVAAMLATSALAPATAQVADLGTAARTTTNFLNFNPPGLGILPVEITNGALRVSTAVPLSYAGNLTDRLGTLSVRKTGDGALTLSGVNSFSGTFTVSDGSVIAGSATALSPNALLSLTPQVGDVITVDLNGFSNSVRALSGTSTTIVTAGSGPAVLTISGNQDATFSGGLQGALGITKSGTGIQSFRNLDPIVAPTTMTGPITLAAGGIRIDGTNALGSGTMTVTGDSSFGNRAVGTAVFDNDIVVNAALTVVARNDSVLQLNGDISGTGSLIKTAAGTLQLTGENSYSGGTTLGAIGRTEVGTNSALGTGTVNVTSIFATIALVNPATNISLGNRIELTTNNLIVEGGNAGTVFSLTGQIAGANNLVVTSAAGGSVLLSGNNSAHTGRIDIETDGVLAVGASNSVASQSAIRASDAATLRFAAAGIDIAAPITNNPAAAATLTIDTGAFNGSVSGALRSDSGAAGLTVLKTGSGILTVSNTAAAADGGNQLTGIGVNAGTLNLTGALAAAVGVTSGGTFAGTGTQSAGGTIVASGGTLSPGNALTGANAVGTLTLSSLDLQAGSISAFNLGAPAASDLVVVSSNLALGGQLNVNGLAGFGSGNYTLFTYGGTLSGAIGLGTLPTGYNYSITTDANSVDLAVSITDFYWDGNGPAGNGVVNGGSGTWNLANTNWTNQTGVGTEAWQNGGNAFFTNTGGAVTLADNISYDLITFQGDGYVIDDAAGQTLSAVGGTIAVSTGNTATINAVLAGTGGLSKIGSGTLVLGAANTVTGGITINGGTLAVTSAAALGPDAVFINGGAQTLRFDNSMTVANTINGAGVGYNIDTGANTVILNGSLSGGGADKFGTGTLVLNNAINAQPNALAVFAGTLIVNGGVQGGVGGSGTSTIGGSGTITGLVSTNGTLSPGAAPGQVGTLTVGSLTTTSNSTLLFDLGALGGTNDLVVSNGGLILDGALNVNPLAGFNVGTGSYTLITYAGALTNNGLNLGTSLTNGLPTGVSYAVDVATAGQINLVRSYAGSFNWDGAGPAADGVLQGGSGTWNAGSTNWANVDGTFNLAYVDGSATVANFGGAAGGTVTLDGGRTAGTLNFTTGGYTLGGSALTLAGDATISVASALTAVIDSEVAGVDGLTKTGAGTLVLNAANSYTGGTALDAGTIRIGNPGALGSGDVTMADATTLAVPSTTSVAIANNIIVNGAGNFDPAGQSFQLDGIVSGLGSVNVVGGGTLLLYGVNTYEGGTNLNAGVIAVNNNASLGTGALTIRNNAAVRADADGLVLGNDVALAGAGGVNVNGNVLTLAGDVSGPGLLSVFGGGELVLSGANSHAGGTSITSTNLRVGNEDAIGTGTLTTAGNVRLFVGLTQAQQLFTFDNAVSLGAGTLTVDLLGNSGGIGSNFYTSSGNDAVFNGVITGAGGLATANLGTLTLNGANLYTGDTTLASFSRLRVGNNSALGTGTLRMGSLSLLVNDTASTITLANNIVAATSSSGVSIGGSGDLVLNGIVSSSGSSSVLNKFGTGTLVLNGANTYGGDTNLNIGAITVGNNAALSTGQLRVSPLDPGTTIALSNGGTNISLANAIAVNNGTLTVNSGATPANFTLGGVISGNGGIRKTGTGTLNLTGASTYTGATTVTAGTLNVTGSLASAVTVDSGAGITGTGSVGALTVSAGGAINPGAPGTNNIATLTVNGPASLLGTTTLNFSGATNDRITATGALTLGGTLAVGSVVNPVFNNTYTLATGSSRTGTFSPVNGLTLFGPAFVANVEYTATAVNLRLTPGSLVAVAAGFGGVTGNALEAAQAFDRATALGYNPQSFLALYTAGSALPGALRQISGEQRATERRVVLESTRVVRETALDRLNLGLASMAGQLVQGAENDTSVTFWLRGAGSWGTSDTSGAATGFTTEQRGLLTGIDWTRDGLTVGTMFNYTSTDIEYGVLGGSSNVESTGGTLYAGYRRDSGLVANAGISVAGVRASGARAISLPGLVQSLQGRTTGTTVQVFGELAVDLAGSANARIEPFARLSYVQADIKALNETNGVAALNAAKWTYDLAITNLGLRVGTGFGGDKVSLNASAAWQHTSGARDAATFIGIPAVGQNGLIRSVALDPDAALLQADIGFNLSDRARLNVGYSGLVGKNNSDHGGRATLNFAF